MSRGPFWGPDPAMFTWVQEIARNQEALLKDVGGLTDAVDAISEPFSELTKNLTSCTR
jgi:hypothetical protein